MDSDDALVGCPEAQASFQEKTIHGKSLFSPVLLGRYAFVCHSKLGRGQRDKSFPQIIPWRTIFSPNDVASSPGTADYSSGSPLWIFSQSNGTTLCGDGALHPMDSWEIQAMVDNDPLAAVKPPSLSFHSTWHSLKITVLPAKGAKKWGGGEHVESVLCSMTSEHMDSTIMAR